MGRRVPTPNTRRHRHTCRRCRPGRARSDARLLPAVTPGRSRGPDDRAQDGVAGRDKAVALPRSRTPARIIHEFHCYRAKPASVGVRSPVLSADSPAACDHTQRRDGIVRIFGMPHCDPKTAARRKPRASDGSDGPERAAGEGRLSPMPPLPSDRPLRGPPFTVAARSSMTGQCRVQPSGQSARIANNPENPRTFSLSGHSRRLNS